MTNPAVFTLPVDSIKHLVAEGILAQLSGEQKEAIITEALTFLLKPVREHGLYGARERSPLQNAFEMATLKVANDIARELIEENPEIRQRIKDTIHDSIGLVLAERNVFSNAISNAIDTALRDKDT